MPITLYGIHNCDSIKKAQKWLLDNAVEFTFHDYRKDGLDPSLLSKFEAAIGWESLLNKRSTTWRLLPDDVKQNIDKASALSVMHENPAIIKRPILDTGESFELGFKATAYQQLFSS